MKQIPPIPLLLAFDAVARLRSFHKAAEALSLAHSTVSHRIRELEEQCGFALFVRTTRTVTPTAEAERLLGPVREALATLGAAFGAARDTRTVRVSVLPSFARFRVVPALTAFQRRHPQIAIALDPTSQMIVPRHGDADVALRFTRAKPVEPHLDLGHDEWFPVAAPGYLATLSRRALPGVFGEAMLLSHSRHAWEPWFRAAGLAMPRSRRVTTFTDTGLMLDAAIRGQGIAYGRRSLLLHLLASGQLVRLSPIGLASAHSYYLMASERIETSPEIRVVHDWIRQLVEEDAVGQAA